MSGERPTALDLLARLVSYDTETPRSNLPLIDAVAAFLAGWNVPFVRVPNSAGDKHALFATIGPADRGGLVLSGHTDCVSVAGQSWTADPFRLRVQDGRAYGRGAVDMKGFCALALAAVPDFLAADLQVPVHILLSYDEETTCLGVVDTIRRFGGDLPVPIAAIVGEPTDLQVVDAHKSVGTFTTTVHGFEAHSSKPYLGANAVMAAGELLAELNRIADEMEGRGDPSGRFDPAWTTVHVGSVRGGTARNILPKECCFGWEFRGVPGLDPDEIPARLARYGEDVVLPRLNRWGEFGRIETVRDILVPGLAPETGSLAERIATELTGRNGTATVPFATEGGRFQAAGIPTVICGPGSIDQAHQPDEYITLDALAEGERFMRRVAEWCSR